MAGTEPGTGGDSAPEVRLEDLDPFSFGRRPETDPSPPAFKIEAALEGATEERLVGVDGCYMVPISQLAYPAMLERPLPIDVHRRMHPPTIVHLSNPEAERSWVGERMRNRETFTVDRGLHGTVTGRITSNGYERSRPPAGFEPWDTDRYAKEIQRTKYRGTWEEISRQAWGGAPRIKVVAGKAVIGTIPRHGHVEGSSAYQFRVRDPNCIDTALPSYDTRAQTCFVMLYDMWTDDGGWTLERVMQAEGVDRRLIERIPGWLPSSS